VNLVGNAIKFTDQGKVHITVHPFSPSLLSPALSLIPLPSSHSSPSSSTMFPPQPLTPSHLSTCNSTTASTTATTTTTTTPSSSAASACATAPPPSPSAPAAPDDPSAARGDVDNGGNGGDGPSGRGSEGAAAPGGEGVALLFTISDTGVGIPEGEQRRIFCAFEQADSSMSRQHGGTGLGLSITSRLVHMMGGSIWLHSSPGAGSTFAFSATFAAPPLSPCTPRAAPRAAPPPPRRTLSAEELDGRLALDALSLSPLPSLVLHRSSRAPPPPLSPSAASCAASAGAPLSARAPAAARMGFSFPGRACAGTGGAAEQGVAVHGGGEGAGMDARADAAARAGGGDAVQAVRRGEGRAGRSRRRTQSFTCGDASTGRMLEEVLRQAGAEQQAGQQLLQQPAKLPSTRFAAAGPHAHASAAPHAHASAALAAAAAPAAAGGSYGGGGGRGPEAHADTGSGVDRTQHSGVSGTAAAAAVAAAAAAGAAEKGAAKTSSGSDGWMFPFGLSASH
ncbi:unnamed protein product, partial [Closterium sp. NIES-54]